MGPLPSGTVTFLFTDIEGSTNLARSLGERWPDVLQDHHAILRAAVESNGGVVVRTEGDAVFAAFASAADALAAAVQAQRGLGEHPWPADGPVRVRMGMHTGEGHVVGDDYVGLDVHRAARIAAAGHGGQVLLSATTHTLAGGELRDGLAVRELGRHRLKDFDEAQPLFQLMIEGLPGEFPALRTLEVPSRLPVQLTSFVGRERELSEIAGLLEASRLVTLVGSGGSGKTRLSVETARRTEAAYPDGTTFADLSPIQDAGLVASTIVVVLGLKQQLDRSPVDTLTRFLADRRALLVLDNFEQVLDAAPVVDEILRAAPEVRVLATSRTRLGLSGERTFPVSPLGLPEAGADLEAVAANEAVALFRDRARAVRPDFEIDERTAAAVAAICLRLEGLPLAIELAAPQIRLLTPEELLARLEHRLPLQSGAANVPARQRTLRQAIGWSYDLLGEPERGMFARVSAFVGGASAAAIEAVTNPDGELGADTLELLSALFDASLVRRGESAEGSRFRMLETIREFAGEQLRAGADAEETLRRHAEHFADLAERWGPEIRSPRSAQAVAALAADDDNIRAALEWASGARRADLGLRIGAAMWTFWVERGHLAEGLAAIERFLDLPSQAGQEGLRVDALRALAALRYWQTDYVESARRYREAMALAESLGDPQGFVRSEMDLVYALLAQDEQEAVVPLIEDARVRAASLGNPAYVAEALGLFAISLSQRGEYERALAAHTEALSVIEGLDRPALTWVGEARGRIGNVLRLMGRLDEAEEYLLAGLSMGGLPAGNLASVVLAQQMAGLAWARDDPERAIRLLGFAEASAERIGGAPPLAIIEVEDPAKVREQARGILGDANVDRLWAEGRALSLEDGLAYVRGDRR